MKAADPLPRLPYILLAALSLVSFAGPFLIIMVIRGGESSLWPPDRLVEWLAIGVLLALFLFLFAACLSIRIWHRPKTEGEPVPELPGRDDDVER